MTKEGEMTINGKDAWKYWGVFLTDTALSVLIEPEPLKDPVSFKSPTENGTQVFVDDDPRVDEREFALGVAIAATDRADLYTKLAAFKTELKKRRIEIATMYEPNVVYRCDYKSCTGFKSFHQGLAKFSLKLREPNPANRNKAGL